MSESPSPSQAATTNPLSTDEPGSDLREHVSNRYAQIAESGGACCGPETHPSSPEGLAEHGNAIGYAEDELAALPDGANLGLGCGNPTALTHIHEGMTVVDLGSGAGVDCFIAAPRVGKTGKVIGVDMTDAMLDRANQYAKDHGYDNVEFRKGFIEQMPVDDASVDLVISNCVINLSPDKSKVFAEINRVLKPGGRAAISDIVLLKPLPKQIAEHPEAYCGCISGALLIHEYLGHAMMAGLNVERADRKAYDVMAVLGCSPEAGKMLEDLPKDFAGTDHVASLDLLLAKPAAVQLATQGGCAPGSGCC